MTPLAERIAAVQSRILAAAKSAGRDPAEVTLVAVSKTHPPESIAAAAECGLRHFGENRVKEALPKMQALASRPELAWHMVGHLQSRKAQEAATAGFVLIHSVDSLKLAGRLARVAEAEGRRLEVLLECNVSGETSKAGFAAADRAQWAGLLPDIEAITTLRGVRVRGLMTLAPIVVQPADARPYFARLRELREYLQRALPAADWAQLSMGMTDDFEAAILEGATVVRIGRAIFGERG